ncbi:hypothetical protein LTR62_005739 [Meristemomyces frigidus]|uniref:Uncharacterized protein n=1 Tax=Meristemomyces frigidus TaxID=1508187 RepID=A0AAN7TF26_9PEZI|nr:hypothetical protein LTR62_005739 [Meristemomyces frigidus]
MPSKSDKDEEHHNFKQVQSERFPTVMSASRMLQYVVTNTPAPHPRMFEPSFPSRKEAEAVPGIYRAPEFGASRRNEEVVGGARENSDALVTVSEHDGADHGRPGCATCFNAKRIGEEEGVAGSTTCFAGQQVVDIALMCWGPGSAFARTVYDDLFTDSKSDGACPGAVMCNIEPEHDGEDDMDVHSASAVPENFPNQIPAITVQPPSERGEREDFEQIRCRKRRSSDVFEQLPFMSRKRLGSDSGGIACASSLPLQWLQEEAIDPMWLEGYADFFQQPLQSIRSASKNQEYAGIDFF